MLLLLMEHFDLIYLIFTASFLFYFDKLPKDWLLKEESIVKQRIICDYISGMTDRYASKLYKSIYD